MQVNVKTVLIAWGGYVRFTDCKGYPTMQAFMRESPEERTKRRYLARLDDDTLEKVDKQMRKLEADDKLQFDVLFLKYAVGLENQQVWRKLSLNKTAFYETLRLAERFVEGALAGCEVYFLL